MKTVIGLSLNFDEECLILSWFYDFECKDFNWCKNRFDIENPLFKGVLRVYRGRESNPH